MEVKHFFTWNIWGDKNKAKGPKLTHRRLQSDPLDTWAKTFEAELNFWTFNWIYLNFIAFLTETPTWPFLLLKPK